MFIVDGQITHLDVFLYFFFSFFRKQKSTVSGWQQKVCGSPFPAKYNASNVKTAVVTQLDYSYYSKNKPLSFLFWGLVGFFFVFPKEDFKGRTTISRTTSRMCRFCFVFFFFLRQGVCLCGSSFPLACQQLSCPDNYSGYW